MFSTLKVISMVITVLVFVCFTISLILDSTGNMTSRSRDIVNIVTPFVQLFNLLFQLSLLIGDDIYYYITFYDLIVLTINGLILIYVLIIMSINS